MKEPIFPRPQLKTESNKTGRREPKCLSQKVYDHPQAVQIWLLPLYYIDSPPHPKKEQVYALQHKHFLNMSALNICSCRPHAPSGLPRYHFSRKLSWSPPPLVSSPWLGHPQQSFLHVLSVPPLALSGPGGRLPSPAASLSNRVSHPCTMPWAGYVCQPWRAAPVC